MKTGMLVFALLALSPIAVSAHDDAQQGMMSGMMPGMHGTAGAGHAEDGGQAQAAGKPGDPKRASRAIRVAMSDDMRFTPADIDVKRGETIRFVVSNTGRIRHEMVIGSMAELKEHAEMMRKMPGMLHADPNMVSVEPGETGELVWHFTKARTFDFACLQPGHFEAGMMGTVAVK
ncbi:MAG: cupredoxin domain-containing protein [Burkholderiales bacterium]